MSSVFLPNILLDEDNFPTWLFRLESFLEGLNLIGYVDGTTVCPTLSVTAPDGTSSPNPAYNAWKVQDKYIMNMIGQTLSPMAMKSAVGSKTSEEMWRNLHAKFAAPDRQNILQLKENLNQIRKGDDTIEVYLDRIKQARDALLTVGANVDDEDLILTVLRGLPPEYVHAKLLLRNNPKCSMTELKSLLKGAEFDLQDGSKATTGFPFTAMMAQSSSSRPTIPSLTNSVQNMSIGQSSNPVSSQAAYAPVSVIPSGISLETLTAALLANGKGKGKSFGGKSGGYKQGYKGGQQVYKTVQGSDTGKCQLCGQSGHIAKTCPHLAKYQKTDAPRVVCQYCNRPFHTADKCYQLIGFPDQQNNEEELATEEAIAMVTAATGDKKNSAPAFWLLDSGATHHMTNDINMLKTVTSYPNNDGVVIGQGSGQNTIPRAE